MPLCIGKMTVNVSLCGAIPRGACSAHENITTNDFNKQGAPSPPASTLSPSPKTCDRSKTAPFLSGDKRKPSQLAISVSHSEDSQDSNMTRLANRQHCNTLPVVEPPRWAVPAKGEARLEVSDFLGAPIEIVRQRMLISKMCSLVSFFRSFHSLFAKHSEHMDELT